MYFDSQEREREVEQLRQDNERLFSDMERYQSTIRDYEHKLEIGALIVVDPSKRRDANDHNRDTSALRQRITDMEAADLDMRRTLLSIREVNSKLQSDIDTANDRYNSMERQYDNDRLKWNNQSQQCRHHTVTIDDLKSQLEVGILIFHHAPYAQ
jgi:chromosome segregation ATPase